MAVGGVAVDVQDRAMRCCQGPWLQDWVLLSIGEMISTVSWGRGASLPVLTAHKCVVPRVWWHSHPRLGVLGPQVPPGPFRERPLCRGKGASQWDIRRTSLQSLTSHLHSLLFLLISTCCLLPLFGHVFDEYA